MLRDSRCLWNSWAFDVAVSSFVAHDFSFFFCDRVFGELKKKKECSESSKQAAAVRPCVCRTQFRVALEHYSKLTMNEWVISPILFSTRSRGITQHLLCRARMKKKKNKYTKTDSKLTFDRKMLKDCLADTLARDHRFNSACL